MIKKILNQHSTPFYFYNQAIIEDKISFLKSLKLDFQHNFYYAVKANPNLAIINLFKNNDFGSVVVSSGEIYKSIRSGIEPFKIILNGSSKNEFDLKYSITQKIHSINIENIDEIEFINNYSKEKNLCTNIGIRINPGVDGGTLPKISTGKKGDKFGIEISQIDFDFIKKFSNINLRMLSVHIGSQITNYQKFIDSYKILIQLADKLNKIGFNIECLDFGGGFPVIDNNSNKLNYELWTKELNEIMKNKSYHIVFEPGRFLIAESGSLVSKINYIKKSGEKKIILLDSSMSEYIRPMLYGIKPIMELLSEQLSQKKIMYDVAGGVCESTDFFIRDIILNEANVGDYLIFNNVGAYGASMSSTYNTRSKPLEILVDKDNHRVIRSRDTLEDLCQNEIM